MYGQHGYGKPGYATAFTSPRNGLGTSGMVLGIIGVVLSIAGIGALLGILAVIFSSIGLARCKRGEATNRGSAVAGLILGIVAIFLVVVLFATGGASYHTITFSSGGGEGV